MSDGRPGARFNLGNIQEGIDSAAFYGLIWSLLENEAAMLLQKDSKPVDVATQRRSLWHGVNIQPTRHGANDDEGEAKVGDDEFAVQTLYGAIKPDRRVVLCAAFNSPLAPDILICASIGSEGIDLHKECAEVIHHDLPWNPAKLEQRIGRVDRVGSLAETPGQWIRVGIPFH